MNTDKPKRKNNAELILYPQERWKSVLVAVCFPILIYSMADATAGQPQHHVIILGFIATMIALLFAVNAWIRLNSFLVIDTEGFLWVRGKLKYIIPWKQITGFDAEKNGRNYRIDLSLSHPIAPQTNQKYLRRVFAIRFFPLEDYTKVPVKRAGSKHQINVEEFRQSNVGAIMYQHIPDIFHALYTF